MKVGRFRLFGPPKTKALVVVVIADDAKTVAAAAAVNEMIVFVENFMMIFVDLVEVFSFRSSIFEYRLLCRY